MRPIIALLIAAFTSLAAPRDAGAQATRTWVSGAGDDTMPCSRTAPCKTFAGAIAKTAAGGEIDALAPSEFGPVTINKAITIDGHGSFGGTRASGTTGITVGAGASDAVTLRGLAVHGDGTASGILFSGGASLHVEDCTVQGFKEGVDIEPAAAARVSLLRVRSRGNTDAGVLVRSAAGPTAVILSGVQLEENGTGLLAGAGARVSVYDSVTAGNSGTGVAATLDGSGGAAEVNLQGVAINENGVGVAAAAPAGSAVVRMSQVLGTGNGTGPTAATGNGTILSFGDNRLEVRPGLQLSSAAPSQQVASGMTATYPVAVAVTGLLTDPISFACADLPAGAACRFKPAVLAAGGMVTVTVTTAPGATGGSSAWPWPRARSAAVVFLFLSLWALLLASARTGRLRRAARGAAAVVLLLALGYAGCSGSPGGADMSGTPDMGTKVPMGTYPFRLTATSGALGASLPLTLIIN